MVPDTYMSMDEAARLVGVNKRTIRRRIAEGALPAYRSGRIIRVKAADVEQLLRRIPTAGQGAAA